ncbi:MAG: deoxyribose-phosphate aldolase [Saccharofermentanales bacterium]
MENYEILKHIDHTLLKPVSSWEQIVKLCEEAIKYNTASVCIPPTFIKRVKDEYKDKLNICTVIGFPLGYNTSDVKVFETQKAVEEGADEIDMVINICDAKDHNFKNIENEIKLIRDACPNQILKVIIETCYLTEEEKVEICKCVTNAGADYIKTSTGFGTGGATIEDVKLLKKHIGADVKIKAAGGMKTKEDLVKFIEEGCDRLGTSSGVSLLTTQF